MPSSTTHPPHRKAGKAPGILTASKPTRAAGSNAGASRRGRRGHRLLARETEKLAAKFR